MSQATVGMPWGYSTQIEGRFRSSGHAGGLTGTANVTLLPDMGHRRATTVKERQETFGCWSCGVRGPLEVRVG
jgi:hypothetical protein